MCKERIETAALTVAGINRAVWNQEKELLELETDPEKYSREKLQSKLAREGHDTPEVKASKAAYDQLHSCCKYIRTASPDEKILTVKFAVTGMTCAEGCAAGIREALYRQKGVKKSEVSFDTGVATILYDTEKTNKEALKKIIESFQPAGETTMKYTAEEITE